jgi:hypothetical protein
MNDAEATHRVDQWECEAWAEFVAIAAAHGVNLDELHGPSLLMELLHAAVTSGLAYGLQAAKRHIDGTR